MAFLNYGILRFTKQIKELNKTELIIFTYINSNKNKTTLTLKQWALLLGSNERTISRAINNLTKNKLIINQSFKNKLILDSILNNKKVYTEEEINKAFKEIGLL